MPNENKDRVGFNSNRLIIALPPCDLPTSVEWTINLASLYWPFSISHEFISQVGMGEDPDVLKNHSVAYALSVKARYIWFLKNYTLPPNWAVHRFLEAMRADPMIMVLAGMNETNVPETVDFCDDVRIIVDTNKNEFEILDVKSNNSLNLECTIIKMEVFDLIDEPWFIKTDKSAEYNFCNKVINAGYKVCAHTGVMCGTVDMKTGKSKWPEGALLTV